jgi:hypothetical protein
VADAWRQDGAVLTSAPTLDGVAELRIGTRERELAMGALDEHLREGRLDPTEYGERSAIAANARFRSEIDALFTDLPAPHPAYPAAHAASTVPDGGAAPAPSGPAPVDARHDAAGSPDRTEDLPELVAPLGARLGRNAGKLSALAPVIAIALFVLTGFRFPQVFLLVPVAIALLGWLGHRHGG